MISSSVLCVVNLGTIHLQHNTAPAAIVLCCTRFFFAFYCLPTFTFIQTIHNHLIPINFEHFVFLFLSSLLPTLSPRSIPFCCDKYLCSDEQYHDQMAMLTHFKKLVLRLDVVDGQCDGILEKDLFFEGTESYICLQMVVTALMYLLTLTMLLHALFIPYSSHILISPTTKYTLFSIFSSYIQGLRTFFPVKTEARMRALHQIVFDEVCSPITSSSLCYSCLPSRNTWTHSIPLLYFVSLPLVSFLNR